MASTCNDADVLERFHPVVASWFRERFHAPTEPQVRGWPEIASGRDTLIAAPTGSGKTLAAFLACLDQLIRRGLAEGLPNRTQILYVSPLKALSNDVHRNLEVPLAELRERAAREGLALPAIRAAVRTGDTPQSERSKMRRKPPHILVTTPESLFILLTSEGGRASLSDVRTVIVDEIHAVARDKRGAHLTLTLERLDRLVEAEIGRSPVRVGLSATQRPIEMIADMLGGTRRRRPHIIDGGHARALDIAIEMTDDELGAVASNEQMGRVYDRIAQLVTEHDTTLVFVNTRRLVERVSHALEDRLGEEQVVAHHGSMSRKLRFAAEQKLKHGRVKCAVATASLELGIDVGSVDLVVQIGSPRSIATVLQRIGRSGHSLGKTPKGRLFASTRDQLVECAALVRAVVGGRLDAVQPMLSPLDILSQQIVAACACEPLGEDELYALCRGAFHYAGLERGEFDAVIEMLAEGVSDRRGRSMAHLHRDRVNARVKGRRGARLAAITSGGAIPDNANYTVVLYPEETRIGELDEDFAIESSAGDVFLLGNNSWRIRRVETGRVLVEDAAGAPPTIPFWVGEAPARTAELSDEVSALRTEVDDRLDAGHGAAEIAEWLSAEAGMPRGLADQAVAYLSVSRTALGGLPTGRKIVAERFFDEAGGMQLVLHAPLGGRINRAWGLALRKRFCRSFDFELQAAATDDGIVISLGQPHSFPLEDVSRFLSSTTVREVLIQALLAAPMFEIRWRWNATRALAVLRRFGGKKVAPHLLRMRVADLLSVVFPQAQACLENVVGNIEPPDHPLVNETIRDCLTEAMDIDGLEALIRGLEGGEIEFVGRDTVEPSPLSHELLNANPYAFLDDAPLEERRTRAVTLRRGLNPDLQAGMGSLDAEAIARAEDEARPTVRDADELHDALLSLYAIPDAMLRREGWLAWAGELAAAGRATCLCGDAVGWVAAERLPIVAAAIPGAIAEPALPPLPFAVEVPEPDAAVTRIVAAQLDYSGPRTAARLAAELGITRERVDAALLALEADGAILRGSFTPAGPSARAPSGNRTEGDGVEWCNRRILARIHRLTVRRLRSEIEPVSAAALMRFLVKWQRVTRGSRLIGIDGLGMIIDQLQGFESAAGAWEREILPARLHEYDQSWLDQLCLSGQIAWCRLSPRRRKPTDDDRDREEPVEDDHAIEETDLCDPDDLAAGHGHAAAGNGSNGNGGNGSGNGHGNGHAGNGKPAATPRHAPTKAAPLALLMRADLAWLRAPGALSASGDPLDGLSEIACTVHGHLAERGACFLGEIATATGLVPDQVEDGLWELVAAGLATADGFASLRVLVDRHRGEVRSHFDRGLRTPSRSSRWREAVRNARRRDRRRPAQSLRSLPTAAGRWTLLGAPDADAIDAETTARQLLTRYGVVFRDLLVRESSLPPWREIAVALRRLEARGEIRGGRFVAGFVGEQFALPEAVEGLRAARNPPAIPELVRVAATDPLNLVGITSAGPKVPAIMGNAVLLRDGVAIASLESGEVVIRHPLEPGARVDATLGYHPPPRRDPPPQPHLPLFS